MPRALIASLVFTSLAACAAPTPGVRLDEQTIHPAQPPIAPFTECRVYTAREPAASASHLPVCSATPYTRHPPTGGDHYGTWAAFKTYAQPVPWGFLVHSMEHGAIVLAYRCDTACPALVASLQALIDARPVDRLCRNEDRTTRLILVPDPDLEMPIAAVAWEHLYLATCFDEASLGAFVDAHYARGPEDLCVAGADLSATGWCP